MAHYTSQLSAEALKTFEQVPDLYLILSCNLTILTASDPYLKATRTIRENIVGKPLFEVFPDNPMATEANAVRNLHYSLQQVLQHKKPHRMALQHYDVLDATRLGGFTEKYWLPLNTPVLDEEGQVMYIIHKVEDMTELVSKEKENTREFRHLNDAQTIGHIGSFERYLTEERITCSNEWYRLHGLEPQSEPITTKRMYAFFHPEDRQQTIQAIEHTLATCAPLQLIGRIVRADGAIRYVQRTAEVLRNDKGESYKIYGTVQDITEQVVARKQVEEREALLRATEEVAQLGSYELDIATMSIRFSDGLYRLFGEAPQTFVPSLSFIDARSHPEDVPVVRAILEQAISQRTPYEYTRHIYRADGAMRTLHAQGRVISGPDGRAVKLIGLVQDVTDRQKAEQELKQSRELLQTTIDSSLDMIQVFEAVRNETGDIVDFNWILNNQTSEKTYGDVIGKSLLKHNPGVVREGIFDAFRQVVETGIPDQSERNYVYEQFNGWFHQSTVKLHDGVATTTHDITERKKAEQALLQSKNLLQGIIDAPNVGMVVYKAVRDEKGNILDFVHEFINKRTLEVLGGYDMTGKLLSDHGKVGSQQIAEFSDVLATGKTSSYVIQRELMGTNQWILISNGRLDAERLVHVWEDITAQKEQDQEVLRLKDEVAQRAADKYHTLFDTIEEGLAIFSVVRDNEGEIVDLRYLELNRAMEQQTGLDRHDIIGKKLSEVFPKADAERWIALYNTALYRGNPVTFEAYTDFLNRWYAVSVYPNSEEVSIFYRDITERKQREQQQGFLLKLSDTLRAEPDMDAVAYRALQMLSEELRLDRCYIAVYRQEDDHANITHQVGNDQVPPLPEGGIRLSDFPEAFRVAYNRTLVTDDLSKTEGLSDTDRQNIGGLGLRALVAATLRKGDNNPHWVLVAVSAAPRRWTQGEIALIEEVTERTWTAMERAKAQEALHRSEEKYRTLFNSMDEGYCIIQLLYDDAGDATDFRFLQVNQAFARNTDLVDVEGKTIRELAPDIEPKWIEIYDQVARTGTPLRFEESSEALHHIFSLYAFRIGEPAERKIAVIFSDVTERRKSQEALQQSEEQFRLFVTASSDIIYKMNADWSSMHKLTGKDFLINTDKPTYTWLDEYTLAEDRDMVSATISEAIRTKTPFELEHRVNKADGTVGWVASRAVPVLDEQGAIKEWFGTASDITLRKEAEQQLHDLNESLEQQVAERTHELTESKLFAEQITEATPDFIMIFNLDTNRIEFVNQSPYAENRDRYNETLHIEYKQLISRSHPEDKAKLHEFINGFRTAPDHAAYTLEYRVIDQGRTIWYRSRGKVFRRDVTGKPTHYISIVQDISDLKQLEQENLQMRLEQQRTNLLAILDAQEEERRRISEGLHNGVGQILYAAKIHLNSYRQQSRMQSDAVLKQVDQILEQAIIETRALSHELAPVLLEQFGLKVAMREICTSLSSKSMQMECRLRNVPDNLDKHLQVVIYRIAQELANNVIKHSQASEASLSLSRQKDTLVLLAEDNGKGFDSKRIPKKGIGLQTIRDRVKLLNGIVSINSYPGNGTLIEISFPLSADLPS